MYHGIKLEVVKLSTAKRGFVLIPRRWVEGSFGWMLRFRRILMIKIVAEILP